jgi:hypothetical protein
MDRTEGIRPEICKFFVPVRSTSSRENQPMIRRSLAQGSKDGPKIEGAAGERLQWGTLSGRRLVVLRDI